MKERSIFSLLILGSMILIASCTNDTQPATLIQASQTHIIPNGSYFQYTFTSMKLQQPQYNTTISQCTLPILIADLIKLSLDFTPISPGSQILYNLLVFPQKNPTSESLYQNYVKAAVQGLPGLMPSFPNNYTDPSGSCQQCYQSAIESSYPMACLKCNATSIRISSNSQNWDSSSRPWNSTIMTVIDNSMVIEPTGNEITVNMGYEIDILYQEEFEALFILFMSVVCALLIILSVLAVFITLRVKKVENEISECKSKVKAE